MRKKGHKRKIALDKNPLCKFYGQISKGGLVLIGKAAVLKTAGLCPWGFESLILRQTKLNSAGEVTELAEGARLLSVCGSKAHPGFESLPLRQIDIVCAGQSPSGKAAGFGPAIRGFESSLPSQAQPNCSCWDVV